MKTGIQLGGVAAGVGIGYMAFAAANAWNPVGWSLLAAGATFVGLSAMGGMVISWTQDYAYNKLGIE